MKRMAMIAATTLLLGRGLAAQDTTKAAAPAAAAPQVTVVEAVVARSVLDRQPQDTSSAFPADVGQLISLAHVEPQDCSALLDRSLARGGAGRGGRGAEAHRLHGRSVTD